MIEFKLIKNSINLKEIDVLLFTSKQAIVYTDKISKEWKNKKILAVGKATSKTAKELGAKDIYYPKEFYGENISKDIITMFSDKKILYIRPKIVAFNSRKFLSSFGIEIKEEIIYKTKCLEYKNKNLENDAIIIFTSPSIINCFLKNFKWKNSWRAVVIGDTTLKKIPSNIDAVVSKIATVDSCIEKAMEIIKQ